MEEYIKHLKSHDWHFEATEDHRVWMLGFTSEKRLKARQAQLDPDYKIWNQHCPKGFERNEDGSSRKAD